MAVSMLQTMASHLGRVLPPRHRTLRSTSKPPRQRPGARDRGNSLSTLWPGLSLSARFAFAAAVVLCNGMAIFGGWVATQIERGLTHNAAISDSVYVQSLFSPITPLLTSSERDGAQIADAIARHLKPTPLWGQLTALTIWGADGSVLYSSDAVLAGKKPAPPPEVSEAFDGEARASVFDHRLHMLYPGKPDETTVRTLFTPLSAKGGGPVVAVVQSATNVDAITAELDAIRYQTWMVVGLTTLIMIGILFSIVQKGSHMIEEQRLEIERRLDEEIRLGRTNKALREQLQDANRHGIELGEEQLRRISSNLENGPVQLLALALLRMYELRPPATVDKAGAQHSLADVVDVVEQATTGALREIRDISSGLLLPELGRLSAFEAIDRAILAHEQATGTVVATDLSAFPEHLPVPVTICLFRVVQEGLANAWTHAAGWGQAVTGGCEGDSVVITVSDEGQGFSPDEVLGPKSAKLGLRWLRQRVESIGGTLTIHSAPGEGAQLTARLPLLERDQL